MWRPTTPDNCRWSWRTAWRFCRRFYASPFPLIPTGLAYVYYFCEIINLIGRHRLLHRRIQRVIEPSTTTTTTIIHATTEVHFSFYVYYTFLFVTLLGVFLSSYLFSFFCFLFLSFSFFFVKTKKRRFARIEAREIVPIEDWRKLWFKVVQNWHCLKAMG